MAFSICPVCYRPISVPDPIYSYTDALQWRCALCVAETPKQTCLICGNTTAQTYICDRCQKDLPAHEPFGVVIAQLLTAGISPISWILIQHKLGRMLHIKPREMFERMSSLRSMIATGVAVSAPGQYIETVARRVTHDQPSESCTCALGGAPCSFCTSLTDEEVAIMDQYGLDAVKLARSGQSIPAQEIERWFDAVQDGQFSTKYLEKYMEGSL